MKLLLAAFLGLITSAAFAQAVVVPSAASALPQDLLVHIDRVDGKPEYHHIRKSGRKLTDMGVTTPKAFEASFGKVPTAAARAMTTNATASTAPVTTFPRTSTLTLMPASYGDGSGQSIPNSNLVTGGAMIAALYHEMSYGQETLNVTVNPTANSGVANAGCMWINILEAIDIDSLFTTTVGNNVNFTLVIGPYSGACGFLGAAFVGYPGGYINGFDCSNPSYLKICGHELGHEFGLLHAGSISNGSIAEYGDGYSMMGNTYASHFNADQKSILGWLKASQIVTHPANSTATYTLTPIEKAGGSLYAVRFVGNDGAHYIVDNHEPIGADAALPQSTLVRYTAPLAQQCNGCADDTQVMAALTPSYPVTIADMTFTVQQGTAPPTTCPAGQTGTPPNCVTPPTTCPTGTTGTPPNCVTTPPVGPPAAGGSWKLVQRVTYATQVGGTATMPALPAPTTAGNFLVLAATWANSANLGSVADQRDTWTVPASASIFGVQSRVQIAYAPVSVAGSGKTTLSFPGMPAGTNVYATLSEYSGGSTLDAATTKGATGAPTASLTTTADHDLGVAICTSQGGALTPGVGYTLGMAMGPYYWAADEYNLDVGTAGAKTASFTVAAAPYVCAFAAFR